MHSVLQLCVPGAPFIWRPAVSLLLMCAGVQLSCSALRWNQKSSAELAEIKSPGCFMNILVCLHLVCAAVETLKRSEKEAGNSFVIKMPKFLPIFYFMRNKSYFWNIWFKEGSYLKRQPAIIFFDDVTSAHRCRCWRWRPGCQTVTQWTLGWRWWKRLLWRFLPCRTGWRTRRSRCWGSSLLLWAGLKEEKKKKGGQREKLFPAVPSVQTYQ